MSLIDLSNATHPKRRMREGPARGDAAKFAQKYPPNAKRHTFLRRVLFDHRDAPANPIKTVIDESNKQAVTDKIKQIARDAGARLVGIAELDERLMFEGAQKHGHQFVVVVAMPMKYDFMVDIGPRSQDEVHRVYYELDNIGLKVAQHIGAFGYHATLQPNGGELPLIPYAYLAGLGELGKHGSLISPEIGSSFRLAAVSTDMPLVADGPQEYGIEEMCARCNICERFCPGDAIKPEKQEVNGVLRWYVDTPACNPWFLEMYGCKICLMVCPYNARALSKEQFGPVAKDIRAAKDAKGMLALIEERSDMSFDDKEFEETVGADNFSIF